MSRIGNMPIEIPSDVTVTIEGQQVLVNGPLGSLSATYRPEIKLEQVESKLNVKAKKQDQMSHALHGLTRSLIANMVLGVKTGWEKKLELIGVGYRAQASGDSITLNVGFSHPVVITAPENVKFAVTENTKIVVTGIDKQIVGQVAAGVRAIRPPEPYQGKGIRYVGEYVRRKAGKAGKVGATK